MACTSTKEIEMRIIIFSSYPKGTAPGQRFRYEQYISSLENAGFEINHKSFLSEATWNIYYKEGKLIQKAIGIFLGFFRRFLSMFTLHKYNYIFVYREMAPIGPPIFEWILSKLLRKKYIYDFDDAIWLPNFSDQNAKFQRLKAYWKIKYCIKWATKVVTGNDYLAEYARRFNTVVQVIPTTIDTEKHHNLETKYGTNKIVIGWTGTHTTMHYLNDIIPVLEKLEKKYSFEFRVISNEAPNFKLHSLNYVRWNKSSEIIDLTSINIGIMPLKEDEWSKGKCGFKALQYMALGIVTIASPVGVNTKIIHHLENGLLANTSQEWEESIEKLLNSRTLCEQLGERGKKTVIENYSVLANQSNYLNLFK